MIKRLTNIDWKDEVKGFRVLLLAFFPIFFYIPVNVFGVYTLARVIDIDAGPNRETVLTYTFEIENEEFTKSKQVGGLDTSGVMGSFFVLKVIPEYPQFNSVKDYCDPSNLEYGKLYDTADCRAH